MNDMRATIIPRSDQINADDLIAGPLTITVSSVSIKPGTEQPVTINFDGDGGKPYKPCKSMCRVMVHLWGPDANAYVGRSMTLYRDGKVLWGGMAVGGIRISHMSHIDAAETMMLTETKKSRKPFTVNPLAVAKASPAQKSKPTPMQWFTVRIAALKSEGDCFRLLEEGSKAKALMDQQPEEDRAAIRKMLEARLLDFVDPPNRDAMPDDDLPGDRDAA